MLYDFAILSGVTSLTNKVNLCTWAISFQNRFIINLKFAPPCDNRLYKLYTILPAVTETLPFYQWQTFISNNRL